MHRARPPERRRSPSRDAATRASPARACAAPRRRSILLRELAIELVALAPGDASEHVSHGAGERERVERLDDVADRAEFSWACRLSSWAARADRKTTGISRVSSSDASCSATLHPSTPGIITSSRTSDGRVRLTSSSASEPSAASVTASPSPSRLTRQIVRIERSSSTSRTSGVDSSGRAGPLPPPVSGRWRTRLRQVPSTRWGGRCARDARSVSDLLDLVRRTVVTASPRASWLLGGEVCLKLHAS